jgi:hypothetical protein|nr:MAG TPA: hypothetical protein [Caudoviricetes sp.]
MSLLNKIDKENISSTYKSIASKYVDKFSTRSKDELYIDYDGSDITISGSNSDGLVNFNISTPYIIRDELHKNINIKSDLGLQIIADRDTFSIEQMKIETDKKVFILPHSNNLNRQVMSTIFNINITADRLIFIDKSIQLNRASINVNVLKIQNCSTSTIESAIRGHINAKIVKLEMGKLWELNALFRKGVKARIKDAIESSNVTQEQLESMLQIDPVKNLKLDIYNADEYQISFESVGLTSISLTRDINKYIECKHRAYQFANGWYLIYTKL